MSSLQAIVSRIKTDTNNVADIANNALPKQGGTVTGSITMDADILMASRHRVIGCSVNNDWTRVHGGSTYDSGARIQLAGASTEGYEGHIWLTANNGTSAPILKLIPDGQMIWNSKNIVRSVNSTNATADGNVKITSQDIPIEIISDNSDLNNYTKTATYNCALSATAKTLLNCPVTVAFTLTVVPVGGKGCQQIVSTYNGTGVWSRYKDDGDWLAWKQIIGSASISSTGGTAGSNWYRVYSDGFIIQGGYVSQSGSGGTITFQKAFTTTPTVMLQRKVGVCENCLSGFTTTNFTWVSNTSRDGTTLWTAFGY